MRFLVLIAVALPGGSIAAPPQASSAGRVIQPPATPRAECPDAYRQAKGQVLRPQLLGELPPGDLHLTVQREVNGCPVPTVVRQNIGGVQSEPMEKR